MGLGKKCTALLTGAALLLGAGCAAEIRNIAAKDYISYPKAGPLESQMSHEAMHPSKKTIGHVILELEKEAGADDSDIRFIDSIIDEAKMHITPKEKYSPEDAVRILSRIHYILSDKGYEYRSCNLLNDSTKGSGNKHFKDCYTGSLLYKIIADALDLPIDIVKIDTFSNPEKPNHAFARFYIDSSNCNCSRDCGKGSYVNWETAEKDAMKCNKPDCFYEKWQGVPAERFDVLDYDGIISLSHIDIGSYLLKKGLLDDALRHFQKAVDSDPENPWAFF